MCKRIAIAVLSSLCFIRIAHAQQEENVGVLYGEDHVFSVKAPGGWVLDNQAGAPQGLQAVFYPVGSSWKDAIAMMYVNTAPKRDETVHTLDEFIAGELGRFRNESPKLVVKDHERLKTKDGKTAVVKELSGDNWGNLELVAYIEEEKIFVMIVMNSRNKDEFEKARDPFKELVGSYQFLKDFDYFALAKSIADQEKGTSEGDAYESEASQQLGPDLANVMKECFDKTKKPDDSRFTALVEVQLDGSVSKVLLKPETNIAACLKEYLKKASLPKPPKANWWWSIEMTIR